MNSFKLPNAHDFLAVLHSPLFFIVPVLLGLLILSSAWRTARYLLTLGILGAAVYGLFSLSRLVNNKMAGNSKGIVMPWLTNGHKQVSLPVYQGSNINYGLIVAVAVLLLAIAAVHFMIKGSGYSWGYALSRLGKYLFGDIRKRDGGNVYTFPSVTIGTAIGEAEPGLPGDNINAGHSVKIEGLDRMLNQGIIGPIGSGKTFMTMKPMIFQDLESIAQGTLANMVWISPQPEPSIEKYAESLGIKVRRIHIIDGQSGEGTNIRFNPLDGEDIDAVISNVNVILNEQTADGRKGDAFFDTMASQATTDSLQIYKYMHGFDNEGNRREIDIPGWFDDYLIQMNELYKEAKKIMIVSGLYSQKEPNLNAINVMAPRVRWLAEKVWPKLSEAEQNMLHRAALSIMNEFGYDPSLESKDKDKDGNQNKKTAGAESRSAESYKKIIMGLRGKVRVLISSHAVQELLGANVKSAEGRPNFNFKTWIDPSEWARPKDISAKEIETWRKEAFAAHKGELLSVITGQTDTGKLVGRMMLVFLQQDVLNRPGEDNDKPPVYTYVDEYPAYATKSINEIRTQGRKHCHSMTVAMQSRAQMESIAKGYLETMESSTRHWVYLSNLGVDDALAVSKLCGKVKKLTVNRSTRQIRMGGLGHDNGQPLETRSEREELVDRFSSDFIRYGLSENEVIYVGVKNRKGHAPIRMRIQEPRERADIVKKVMGEAAKSPKKVKIKVKPTSVYPSKEQVARVKRPLLTYRGHTVYFYHWGLSLEHDMEEAKPVTESAPEDVQEKTRPLLNGDLIGWEFFDMEPPKGRPVRKEEQSQAQPSNESKGAEGKEADNPKIKQKESLSKNRKKMFDVIGNDKK